MTQEGIEADYWAHYYDEKGDVEEYETEDYDEEAIDSDDYDLSQWDTIIDDREDQN